MKRYMDAMLKVSIHRLRGNPDRDLLSHLLEEDVQKGVQENDTVPSEASCSSKRNAACICASLRQAKCSSGTWLRITSTSL